MLSAVPGVKVKLGEFLGKPNEPLFLEQILERLPRVVGTQAGGR